ncbi:MULTISPECIES: hypothetical protein [unclassified Nostoc]|nr:hypothetical protein [Nostoc sp. 'Peltigera membranacea cyanobiont' 232]OYE00845.1 hypothetical protein CDG79_32935 [Nostoc sp. 'Peltigera membranacea cyanobiont' 232]OYE01798.1 hypothetical protein CDG79_27485 [Nostoc sp. 'Peltigera membranacea cyanobiont' 232]OYE02925.1 hypothetical protein CDG79_21300 [Nostoc sp. 'Peltigera membranacea cyanobiont' 232]OYE03293.1 hypothetical protein CDG79_19240 [Nostoc sp. 'Peltigera membranacea cyanobiont' 232]
MALRKGKIVEVARVQRSGGAGEKEEGRSETRGIQKEAREILLCPSAPPAPLQSLRHLPFSLT